MSNQEYFDYFFSIVDTKMSYHQAYIATEQWYFAQKGVNKYKNYGTFRVMKSKWLRGKLK
jgi:hypothetical protein